MNKDIAFLKKMRILEECSIEEKEQVLPYLTKVKYKKGQIIFNKGDSGRVIYIVQSGIVGSYTILEDGQRLELGRYSLGMFFGELAIVEELPRATYCYAVENVQLFALDILDFYRFIWNHSEIGVKILKAMMRYMILNLRDADNFLTTMALWGEEARHRAITDELTGLYNKRFFEESLQAALLRVKQNNGRLAVIMFDIDHFRSINRDLDFDFGDNVLIEISKIIKEICKKETVISRLGGDEFVILLPDMPFDKALEIASQIKITIKNKPISLKNEDINMGRIITISIGVAGFPEHGETALALIEAVDAALYKAKEAGRDRIKWPE